MLLLLNRVPDAPPPGLPSGEGCAARSPVYFCPTKWQLWQQVLALLPRGRAWQTHEPPVYALDGQGDPDIETLTVQQRFWASYAEVLEHLHQRACALLNEIFCASVSEMLPDWQTEYGFPDPCEPYDSLCEKVTDVAGTTCADIAAAAWRRGWKIACADCTSAGYVPTVADDAIADCAMVECPCFGLTIKVFLSESPAYVSGSVPAVADFAVADCDDLCDVAIDPLICVIERIRPAHIPVTYEVIP